MSGHRVRHSGDANARSAAGPRAQVVRSRSARSEVDAVLLLHGGVLAARRAIRSRFGTTRVGRDRSQSIGECPGYGALASASKRRSSCRISRTCPPNSGPRAPTSLKRRTSRRCSLGHGSPCDCRLDSPSKAVGSHLCACSTSRQICSRVQSRGRLRCLPALGSSRAHRSSVGASRDQSRATARR
jgi:hypothetical protein